MPPAQRSVTKLVVEGAIIGALGAATGAATLQTATMVDHRRNYVDYPAYPLHPAYNGAAATVTARRSRKRVVDLRKRKQADDARRCGAVPDAPRSRNASRASGPDRRRQH